MSHFPRHNLNFIGVYRYLFSFSDNVVFLLVCFPVYRASPFFGERRHDRVARVERAISFRSYSRRNRTTVSDCRALLNLYAHDELPDPHTEPYAITIALPNHIPVSPSHPLYKSVPPGFGLRPVAVHPARCGWKQRDARRRTRTALTWSMTVSPSSASGRPSSSFPSTSSEVP